MVRVCYVARRDNEYVINVSGNHAGFSSSLPARRRFQLTSPQLPPCWCVSAAGGPATGSTRQDQIRAGCRSETSFQDMQYMRLAQTINRLERKMSALDFHSEIGLTTRGLSWEWLRRKSDAVWRMFMFCAWCNIFPTTYSFSQIFTPFKVTDLVQQRSSQLVLVVYKSVMISKILILFVSKTNY